MPWRTLLIDGPAWLVDRAWSGYWTLVAALAILCYVNVALTLVLYFLGVPLP